MNWQPITTAPKDGTAVLAFWRNKHGGPDGWGVVQYSEGVDPWDGSPGWHEQGNRENAYGEPDYWMPLPSPPQASDQ